MPMSLVAVLVLFTMTLVAPIGSVSAQEATPAAQAATPVAIAASECTVEPRTLAALEEIVTEADIASATADLDPVPYVKPEGTPADEATIAGVTATVRQLVACVNAGDFMRFLALFSNDALRRYSTAIGLPIDPDDDILTPDPSTNEQIVLAGIDDVLVLSDGRVSLLTLIPSEEADGGDDDDAVLQLILVRQGDRWLIDELIPIAPPEDQPPAWTPVSGAGYEGVIVDALSAPEFAQWLTGQEVSGGWEPTPDDIAAIEAALPVFLATAPQATDRLRERLAEYKRQYAGIVDSDNRQVILVNAFCDEGIAGWQSEPVLVLDGGDCFFHVTYDPVAGTFSGLMVNGEA
jgi:hypothetical protein